MNKLKLLALGLIVAGGLSAQSVQCIGYTKSLNQCKNKTLDSTKLCYMHNPNYTQTTEQVKISPAVKCSGTTKQNKPCKNKTKDGSRLCHLHRN